jgi:Ca2+-binding EF-hand superfamily protein
MNYLMNGRLLGVLVSLAGVVFAQPAIPSGQGPVPFSAFDHNSDGAISQQEFESFHAQLQQAHSPQSYSAGRDYDPPQFSAFDQNGDGLLSPNELSQGQRKRQQQRDFGQGHAPRDSVMGQGRGRGMGTGMGSGRGHNMPAFSEFDLDADGLLQRQEFEQGRAQRIRERLEQGYQMRNLQNAPTFSSIDGNGDGVVSRQEFAAAQAQHRQR